MPMSMLSRPQCEILQLLADANEPLSHHAIRQRYTLLRRSIEETTVSPTSTLDALARRGLIESTTPPIAEGTLDEWFGRRWTITARGRVALGLPFPELGGPQ